MQSLHSGFHNFLKLPSVYSSFLRSSQLTWLFLRFCENPKQLYPSRPLKFWISKTAERIISGNYYTSKSTRCCPGSSYLQRHWPTRCVLLMSLALPVGPSDQRCTCCKIIRTTSTYCLALFCTLAQALTAPSLFYSFRPRCQERFALTLLFTLHSA